MEQLSASYSEEDVIVRDTAETTKQLDLAIEQISRGAQEQANNVSQTSERVSQMDQAIDEVAQKTLLVAQAAKDTAEVSELRWFPFHDVPENLSPPVSGIIREFIRKKLGETIE
jgi:methyl-accepting chemotaxis protein